MLVPRPALSGQRISSDPLGVSAGLAPALVCVRANRSRTLAIQVGDDGVDLVWRHR
jgi:hypothetical protein